MGALGVDAREVRARDGGHRVVERLGVQPGGDGGDGLRPEIS